MRSRVIAALAALAVLLVVGVAHAAPRADTPRHWASVEIEQVVEAGVMGPTIEDFRPDEALTWAELAEAVAAIRGRAPIVRDPARLVTLAQLDAWLVRTARLGVAAKHVRRELVRVGFAPPRRVATETVARIARFRLNHEQENETREIAPNAPVSRAEAAYSFARILGLTRWERRAIKRQVRSLSLPEPSDWERELLGRALGVVGFPYVWAGSSSERQQLFGQDVSGGFDCSGFTWYVYKGQSFTGTENPGSQMVGRTSYAMSGEFEPSQRVSFDELRPADVVFFGNSGVESKPSEVGHMGIYLGDGWMVHSSSRGTTIAPMSSYYRERFAWGRRVLAEVGLS